MWNQLGVNVNSVNVLRCRASTFIVTFEPISHIIVVF